MNILHVEDNQGDIVMVATLVSETMEEVDIMSVRTLNKAKIELSGIKYDIVLLDLFLPDSNDPASTLGTIVAWATCPILVLSGIPLHEELIQVTKTLFGVKIISKDDAYENPNTLSGYILELT